MRAALESINGVAGARVDVITGIAYVNVDDDALGPRKIIKEIEDCGYTAKFIPKGTLGMGSEGDSVKWYVTALSALLLWSYDCSLHAQLKK